MVKLSELDPKTASGIREALAGYDAAIHEGNVLDRVLSMTSSDSRGIVLLAEIVDRVHDIENGRTNGSFELSDVDVVKVLGQLKHYVLDVSIGLIAPPLLGGKPTLEDLEVDRTHLYDEAFGEHGFRPRTVRHFLTRVSQGFTDEPLQIPNPLYAIHLPTRRNLVNPSILEWKTDVLNEHTRGHAKFKTVRALYEENPFEPLPMTRYFEAHPNPRPKNQ